MPLVGVGRRDSEHMLYYTVVGAGCQGVRQQCLQRVRPGKRGEFRFRPLRETITRGASHGGAAIRLHSLRRTACGEAGRDVDCPEAVGNSAYFPAAFRRFCTPPPRWPHEGYPHFRKAYYYYYFLDLRKTKIARAPRNRQTTRFPRVILFGILSSFRQAQRKSDEQR